MRLTPTWLAAAVLISIAAPAWAQHESRLFAVPADQNALLKESLLNRLLHSGRFLSCVRAMYGRDEFIRHPLATEYYDILQFFQTSRTSDGGNSLSVLNGGEPFRCKSLHGYCMSLTTYNRDMNLLLQFDPTATDPALAQLKTPEEQFQYYEKLMYDVWSTKKPTVIAGFKDLNEFTSQVLAKEVLWSAIPKNWGDHASIPKIAIGVLFKSRKPMKLDSIAEEIELLKERLTKHYNPVIYLGAKKLVMPNQPDQPSPFPTPTDSVRTAGVEAEVFRSANFDRFPELDLNDLDPRVVEALRQDESLGLGQAPVVGAEAQMLESSIADSDFVKSLEETWIHVTQVTSVEEVVKGQKWIIHVIDPNARAPYNTGKLLVDLKAERPVIYEGATAELYLDAFGELPGDREHMDEIVANLTDWASQNPELFEKLRKAKTAAPVQAPVAKASAKKKK